MHEAFCLSSQADIFNPYEKHHSTVKDAAELAQRLNVKNLILYHTEDENILNRKNYIKVKVQNITMETYTFQMTLKSLLFIN